MNERKSRPQASPNCDRVDGLIGKEKRESLADLPAAVISYIKFTTNGTQPVLKP